MGSTEVTRKKSVRVTCYACPVSAVAGILILSISHY